jgi:N-acyl-phosphatidylethanolamine-hydrolysing phospholipase D
LYYCKSGPLGMGLKELSVTKFHHGDGRFVNPFHTNGRRGLWQVIKWRFFSKSAFEDQYTQQAIRCVYIDWDSIEHYPGLSLTFINHACVLIKDKDIRFLVDPVFFGLFPTITNYSPLQWDAGRLPLPDYVLITHGHYDHLDCRTLKHLGGGPIVVTPLGYRRIFSGLPTRRHIQLDWFEDFAVNGRHLTLLPCHHWTMRNPFSGPNRSLWGSYLLRTKDGYTIYISGDTAFFNGFKEIGERFAIDLAIFNLGAYEPRWFMQNSHMNPSETVKAFIYLKAQRLMIIHWGSFRLGDEPVHWPPLELARELERVHLADRLVPLVHGETYRC